MRTNELGTTGLELTVLGFGTWAAGGSYKFGWGAQDDQESIAAIRYALDRGVNWIDTAAVYGLGHSEEVVGEALQGRAVGRDVYLATKCGGFFKPELGKVIYDLRPESIRRECDQSLQRLGIERIDLYQFHWPDNSTDTPVEESWGTMGELIDEGKVRWGGVSNFDIQRLEACEAVRHVDFLQPPLSMIKRAARDDVIPWCRKQNVGVIVYSPMGSGLLTGKFDRSRAGSLPEDDWRSRNAEFQEPRLSNNLALVDALRSIAERLELDLPQLAIAWTLAVPGVTAAIVGARSTEQVDSWLSASGVVLSGDVLEKIEAVIEESGAGQA